MTLRFTRRFFVPATLLFLLLLWLFSGKGALSDRAVYSGCLLRGPDGALWEVLKDWHDGFNRHPYVQVKVDIDSDGKIVYRRDNASGLMIFRDLTARQYAEAAGRCLREEG